VIASLYGRVRTGQARSVGLPDSGALALASLIGSKAPVIGISFGNPYLLQSFPSLRTYMVAYGDMPSLQQAAARALLGEIDITGKLPISLPGLYARGTGIQPDGRTGGAASGLGPNIQNWALGASITFPAFDWFSIRAKKEIEVHNERSATANYDQTLQDINGGIEKAKAVLEGARRVAQNTPIQLEAARTTEQQATARYKAGLGNIVEVAEAQRLLTQAEIDNSLAQLGIWRAMLGVAAAEGELTPFLASAGK